MKTSITGLSLAGRQRLSGLVLGLFLATLFVFAPWQAGAASNPIAPSMQYFKETGHNVSGLFLQNYYSTGGLTTNGLPLTEEFKENSGMTLQVFERAIFELHQPLEGKGEAQPRPYVEHRLLGVFLAAGKGFTPVGPEQNPDG